MADVIAEMLDETKPAEPVAPVTEAKPVETPPAVVATPEPPKPVEAPKPAEPGHVPIAAMLDEREKRQKLETELAALRAERQKPQQIPSVHEDHEAFARHVQEQAQRIAVDERFNISETLATEKHGADAVKAAMEWGMEKAQASPAFAAEYVKQKHPIDWAVRQHKRDRLISELGDDDASQKAFIERRARELGLIPTADAAQPSPAAPPQPQPQTTQRPPTPPRSIAGATSAGGIQTGGPAGPGVAFDGAFK